MSDSGYFPFHIRHELAEMFEKWADEHGVLKCDESVITYLCMNDLLSYKDIRAFMNSAAKDGANNG